MNDITKQITLSGIILVLIGIIEVCIEIFAVPLTTDEILETEWTILSYGEPSITLSTPREMKITRPHLSKELWNNLQALDTYVYKEAENYRVTVSCARFIPFNKVDLKDVAQVEISEIQNDRKISNVKLKEQPYSLGKLPVIMHVGTCVENEQAYSFTTIYISDKLNLWKVSLFSLHGDFFGKKITEKIVKSITVES